MPASRYIVAFDRIYLRKAVPAMRTGSWPFACVLSRFQTDDSDSGLWSGNETSCAHVYKIRKWGPKQRTAASECCKKLLLTRVNLKQ